MRLVLKLSSSMHTDPVSTHDVHRYKTAHRRGADESDVETQQASGGLRPLETLSGLNAPTQAPSTHTVQSSRSTRRRGSDEASVETRPSRKRARRSPSPMM